MKKSTLIHFIAFAMLLPFLSYSQSSNKPLFDSAWYGFNTGYYPDGQSPSSVKSGDLDNDGDSDLVVSQENFSNGFVMLKNLKKGIYDLPVKYASKNASKDIVIADFNNDSLQDVALTNTGVNFDGNTISVYINKGRAVFKKAVNYTVGSSPVGIAAADFDNDGDIDLAVANNKSATGTLSLLINQGSGVFAPAVTFPSGLTPYKITAAKINSDNLIDIVIGNEGEKMNILFNGGNNDFSNRVEMNVLGFVYGGDANANVEAADFDNDNDNDIIYSSAWTTDGTEGQIALFKNQGNGTFSPVQFINLVAYTGGAVDMSVADLNGDGWKDIVGANFQGRVGDGYQVVLNNGSGGFLPAVVIPAGQSTYTLTTADVDKDGKIDVITTDWYSLQVTVHRNFGKANFGVPSTYFTNNGVPGSLDAADIDGDGDLDVVTSASSIAAVGVVVTVQKNMGNGKFTNGTAYSIRSGGVQAKFRDLNGDRKPDLIFASAISSPPYDFHTAINNGDGTFGPRQTWSMNACGWSDIDAFDMDNDGDLDAVLTEWLGCTNDPNSARRIFISKNNGSGTFGAPLIKIIDPSPSCLAGGDMNHDGKIDLVTGQSLSVDVHIGTGTGDLQPPLQYATENSPYDILLNDFNGDGNLDVATCTEYNFEGMSVLLGNGNGTLQPAQNYKGAYSPDLRNESGITSGDVDADGDIDIIVGNSASNDVSIYLNNGDGTFIFKMRYGLYYSTASPFYADFTGDGKNDIVAAVSLPPSGLTGAIALIKGKIVTPLAKNSADVIIENDAAGKGLVVMNNPFVSYIDVRFEDIVSGSFTLKLTDLSGRVIAISGFTNASPSVFRFNLGTDILPEGAYILSATTEEKTYAKMVVKQ
ncbi:MAG: T9SS type A sorting domain-containing protein [Chitinophagales bacterium]|nr:T9SS type A sorting domain-containing protein [Chitinophagales bacterium]